MKSIKQKILLVLLSVTIAFTLLVGFSMYILSSLTNSYNDVIDRQGQVRNNVQVVVSESVKQSLAVRGLIVSTALENKQQFDQSKEETDKRLQQSLTLVSSQSDKEQLQAMLDLNEQFKVQFDAMNEVAENGGSSKELINMWQNDVYPVGQEMMKTAQDFSTKIDEKMTQAALENETNAARSLIFMIIVSIVLIALAVLASLKFANMISKPIVKVTEATGRMAEGDLTVEPLDVKTKDEIGSLTTAFNQMSTNLRQLVQNVSASSEHVASSSEQLMASSDQTARATEQITSSIQEVASGSRLQEEHIDDNKRALEEMSVGVTRVAEATHSVSELSDNATQMAHHGQDSIDKVVEQMKQISASTTQTADRIHSLNARSTEIANIVGVITEISDQTNLLALNAAIEAARAGEHGKGFAVVAEEVRNLAEQSKKSADDITTLIAEIQQDTKQAVAAMNHGAADVEAGMSAVSQAGEGFNQINEAVRDISGQIMDVTAIAQQMSASATHIVDSMHQISALSQDASGNSESVAAASEQQLASMQEVTAAAEALSKRAEALLQEVQFFKV